MKTMRICTTTILAVALLAGCSDDGPTGGGTIEAEGTYQATFTTTDVSPGCGDLVPVGSTTDVLVVTESDGEVTLELTGLSEFILENPTGEFDARTGVFSFQGSVLVGDDLNQIPAAGNIAGTFTNEGSVDLTFDFTVLDCVVEGTISGTKS